MDFTGAYKNVRCPPPRIEGQTPARHLVPSPYSSSRRPPFFFGFLLARQITVAPIFEACSAVGENCMETGCCHNPGYACMHSKKHAKVAMCHKRTSVPCVDTAEWLCPRGDQCAGVFQDCRSSLCCQTAQFFKGAKDVPFECVRRPHLYFAQCRPVTEPDARHAGSTLAAPACTDSSEWLCPGWERCGAAFAECTRSRCCADEGFSCFLNGTALAAGDGWHAYCRPTNETWGALADADTNDAAMSKEECDEMASRGWLCPSVWRRHVHEAAALAKWYVDEEPAAVAGVALASALVCLLACACCIIHRRRAKRTLTRLNAELSAVRDGLHDAQLKKRGAAEGERLNLAIDGGPSEREPDSPGVGNAAVANGPAAIAGGGGKAAFDGLALMGSDGSVADDDGGSLVDGIDHAAAAAGAAAGAAVPLAGPPEERCSNPVDELARIRAKFAKGGVPPGVPPVAATPLNPGVKAAAAFYGQFAIDTSAAAAASEAADEEAEEVAPPPGIGLPSGGSGEPPLPMKPESKPPAPLQPPAAPPPPPDERSHVVRALQALESRKKPAPPMRKRPVM